MSGEHPPERVPHPTGRRRHTRRRSPVREGRRKWKEPSERRSGHRRLPDRNAETVSELYLSPSTYRHALPSWTVHGSTECFPSRGVALLIRLSTLCDRPSDLGASTPAGDCCRVCCVRSRLREFNPLPTKRMRPRRSGSRRASTAKVTLLDCGRNLWCYSR